MSIYTAISWCLFSVAITISAVAIIIARGALKKVREAQKITEEFEKKRAEEEAEHAMLMQKIAQSRGGVQSRAFSSQQQRVQRQIGKARKDIN